MLEKEFTMRTALLSVLFLGLSMMAAPAQAGRIHVVGHGFYGGFYRPSIVVAGIYAPPVVYTAPAVVYTAPVIYTPPVVYTTPVVYTAPAPVVCTAPVCVVR
jgi:hypothetical protein